MTKQLLRYASAPDSQVDGPLGPICRIWGTLKSQADQLENWADMLQGIPFGVDAAAAKAFASRRPRLEFMNGNDRDQIANYLRKCAAQLRDEPAKRGRGQPSSTPRDYQIALDYHVTLKKLGNVRRKAALAEVMEAWGIKSSSTVTDANRLCRSDANREFDRIERDYPDMSAESLYMAISQQLRSPRKSTE
jgi:hypothetical protein